MRNFWYTCLLTNYVLFFKQKSSVSQLSESKTDLIYLVKNTFYKTFCPKKPKIFLLKLIKLRIIFKKIKNIFWHNSKTDRYI